METHGGGRREEEGGRVCVRGAGGGGRAVLIGTEDRGQEERRSRGETGSPPALRWLTLLNDASLS